MIGASSKAHIDGRDELPGKVNYFIGDDRNKWHANIPTFLKVHYQEIYPGVDVVYYGNRTELEYDFVVAPGGNLRAIKFQVEGAERITLDSAGDLQLVVKQSQVTLRKPVIYQLTEQGDRREVKGAYLLKGKEVGFKVQAFDRSKPLIIDPVLSYSTLLGGNGNEQAFGIAVDPSGNAYLTGVSDFGGFPTTPGAFQTTSFGGAFVSKLDATGTNLVYSTYLSGTSGNGRTNGTAIAVDASGRAYVSGSTTSSDFPTVNGIRGSYNFLKSSDSGGSWTGSNVDPPRSITSLAIDPQTPSTIYAGTDGLGAGVHKSTDNGNNWTALNTGLGSVSVAALAIDPITPGTIYAAINTPTSGVIKSTNGGASWVSFTVAGTGSIFSLAIDPASPATLYLGSNGGLFKTTNGGSSWSASNSGLNTIASTIAVDPTTPATVYAGGAGVFKSTNSGANWSASSTGLPSTTTHRIAIDPVNPATIYAGTGNGVFKSTNAGLNWTISNSGLGTSRIFSFAIDPANPAIIYSGSSDGKIFKTVDGGSNWTSSHSTILGATFNALVIDPSASSTVYAGTRVIGILNDSEAFLAKLNETGSALIYSTFLGGSGSDFGHGVAVDSSQNAYVVGSTTSPDFLTANAFQPSRNGLFDAFVTKINPNGTALLFSTYLGGSAAETAYAIAVDASGNAYVTGNTTSNNFPTANAFQATLGEQFVFGGDAFATKFNANGTLNYSTYLGGSGGDTGYGIAVDSSGNAHITGVTASTNFPTLAPLQPANGGFTGDAFVTKLNSSGSGLIYSTYLGGNSTDIGRGIAVDASGNAYVTGSTRSANFPVAAGAIRTRSPFFKSVDSAEHWSNDNFGLATDIVTTLELQPQNPSTIYAGTGNGVYRSNDGGRSWVAINSGLVRPFVTEIVVDPITPATVYLSASLTDFNNSSGVYKSTDGGNTWNPANNGITNTSVQALAIDPLTPSTLYAGVSSGVFKSTDGGASWTLHGTSILSFIQTIAVNPQNPAIVYAGGNSSAGGVFKSIDGGITWQTFNTGLLSPFVISLEIDPTTPSTVYAAVNGGMCKSVNGANSWTTINNGLPGRFVATIAIDPVTPSTVYVGASSGFSNGGGVFKSTNGGDEWRSVNQGLSYRLVSSVVVNPVTPAIIYAGVNVTPDDDAFVTKLNPGGSAFVYSTFLGDSPADDSSFDTEDQGFAIAVDLGGNAYVAGLSRTPDFPVTPEAFQPFNRGFSDSFVTKLAMSHIIGGQVLDAGNSPVSGATVTLSDGSSLSSIVTGSDGSYQFSHLREGGSFTVSAAKPHFTMTPPSQSFSNLTSNQTVNFIATASNAPFFLINGHVTNNGADLSGVTITLSGSQPGVLTTGSAGSYSVLLPGGGNYTVTPSLLGFTFSPASQTFNNLSADQIANFTGTRQNLVVTNANNHGSGSLRQAMLDANAIAGADTIVFNIPGAGSPHD